MPQDSLPTAKGMRSLRFWVTFAGSAAAITSVVIIIGVWTQDWRLGLPSSTDKVTRINTVAATSAYVAAILAVVFALVAYWQATGRPNLEPRITLPNQPTNQLTFILDNRRGRPRVPWLVPGDISLPEHRVPVKNLGGNVADVQIENTTKYSARNPGLRIEFDGLLYAGRMPGWSITERHYPQVQAFKGIQWDGGTENIIHGKWTRSLPEVGLSELVVIRRERLFGLKQELYGNFTFLAELFLAHQAGTALARKPELSDLDELDRLAGSIQLYAPQKVWLPAIQCAVAIRVMWSPPQGPHSTPEIAANHAVETSVDAYKAMRADLLG